MIEIIEFHLKLIGDKIDLSSLIPLMQNNTIIIYITMPHGKEKHK